jgi:hypothetical protein
MAVTARPSEEQLAAGYGGRKPRLPGLPFG